ncbi:SRPBCC domain-containing protein [Paenibacillus sp. SC116]|uniref:SRPBCC family protein n=1 Tax=Paenibacillus sp. SC116 TaxID=2968986 RepID=UPI00215A66A1|nr:SRPBCC domain-containing protein [Paenibacillus sp. SC116]MCR8842467.1 SRPBCC domain-containing protein [Paenibacillus sp. SC116]
MSLKLELDFQYTTTIEKLWSAITDPNKLEKWVLPNDFKPEVGHHFQFRAEPNEWWDGLIEGEVLVVEEPGRLSYSWASGAEKHLVVWTLQDLGDGKVNLHLEQTGFSNPHGLAGAKHGWTGWCGKLEQVLEQ